MQAVKQNSTNKKFLKKTFSSKLTNKFNIKKWKEFKGVVYYLRKYFFIFT